MESRRIVFATAVVLTSAVVAFAQWSPPPVTLPATDGTDLRFDHLSLGIDPSHRRITGIVQDDLGFLWLGTDDGLKRYDGYRVRDYRHDPKDPNSLPDTYIISLFKDRSGKLWIASGRNLDVYDPSTEKFTPFLAGRRSRERLVARVGEINQDRRGTIWLSTDKGLYEVDPVTGVTFCYQHDGNNPGSMSSDVVRSTLETADGGFWVATTKGVDSIDRTSHKVTRRIAFAMEQSVWTKIIQDHAGVLWLAYSGAHGPGLATIDATTNSLTHFRVIPEAEKISPGVKTIYEDRDGNLWVASSLGGLFRLDRDRTRFVRYRNRPADPTTIASDEITALFEDREGGVWVGTLGDGADRFTRTPLPFQRYVHESGNPNSLEKDAVNAVLQDSRGVLWIGCIRSLVKVDPKTGTFQFFRSHGMPKQGGLSTARVLSMAEDSSGELWFGTQGGGLNHLDSRTGRFQVFWHDKSNSTSLSSDVVTSLHVDHAGVLWAGTDNGLNAFDPRTQSFHVYPPPVSPSTYRWISEDSRGTLWLSTGWSGVHRFDPASGKFTMYRHSDSPGTLSSDAVNGICVDHSGIIWVGTQTGLNRLDPATGAVTVYNEGPSAISIDSILEDSRGGLWLGTGDGLVRFDPRPNTFRHYYAADGLAANELGFSAAWKNSRGEMYFGSYGGLTVFDPARIVEDSPAPPVRLTDIHILGKPVIVGANSPLRQSISMTSSLRLTHAQNTISFEFSALTYASPARNIYRYRLEPLEKEWNEVDSSRRSVTYAELPAGDFFFRVMARNSRGVWNQTAHTLKLSIDPAYYETSWFHAAVAALLIGSLWSLYQYRLRRLAHEYSVRLQERVNERTRIARELHDTLLQNVQAALFQFRAAHKLLFRDPEQAQATLNEAIVNASMAISEARASIQDLRGVAGELGGLENLLTAAGQEFAAADLISPDPPLFTVTVEGSTRALNPVVQDEVYRICREVMANAFQHAHGKRIEAEIRYEERLLRVRIRDDGIGIDSAVLATGAREGHWGLPGIQERAKRIGAQVDIWSEAGAGTEFEVRIRAAVAYAKSQKTSRFGLLRKRREESS